MTDSGTQTMHALTEMRRLFGEIHALLVEGSRQLDQRGWKRATTNVGSHLGNHIDAPEDWLPKVLFRWYHAPERRPGVYLALVVHLEAMDDFPSEPWLVAGAFVLDDGPLGPGERPLKDPMAYQWAAGLDVEDEERVVPDGRLRTRRTDAGVLHSLAVPLMDIGSAEALAQRVIGVIVAAAG